MATSGSIDYNATANDIIKEALTLCGVLAIGDTPSSQDSGTVLRTLNMLVKAWQAEGVNIFARRTLTTSLVSGTSTYTPSTPVMEILHASVRDSNSNDSELELISMYDYQGISDKTQSGSPTRIVHDKRTWTNNKVILWPVPDDSTDTLVISAVVQLEDLDSTSDDMDYPQEWYLPLSYNLAYLIAPKYGVPVQTYQMLRAAAQEWKEIVQGFDREQSVIFGVETYG